MAFSVKHILARSSVLLAARVAGAAAAFAGNILIARWFGASTLGVVALSLAFVGILTLALPLGRQAIGVLYVSKYLANKQPRRISGFIRSGYRTIGVMSLLAISAIAALYPVHHQIMDQDQFLAILFAGLMAPALAILNFTGGVLNGYRKALLAYLPDLVIKPTLVLAAIAGIGLFVPGAQPHILLAGMSLAAWLTAMALLTIVWRYRLFPRASQNLADNKTWRKTARPWLFIILLTDCIADVHLLMAGLIMMPAEIAILHICFRLRMLASFGMRAIYAYVLPDIYAALSQKDDVQVRANLTRGNALALFYAAAVCAGVFVLGDFALGLLGEEFLAGKLALLIVCLTMIPRAIFGPAPQIMAADGRQKSMVVILLASVVLSLACGYLLFGTLGMNAIVIGYGISILFASVTQWWSVKHLTGLDCSIFAAIKFDGPSLRPGTGLFAPKNPS